MRLLLLLLLLFDPGTQFPGNEKKITLCNTKKYKNQAGINITPPSPSQNSHALLLLLLLTSREVMLCAAVSSRL